MRLSTTTTILSRKDKAPPERSVLREMALCRGAGFEHLDMNFHTQAKKGYPLAGEGWERWADEVAQEAARLNVTMLQAHSFVYRTRESADMSLDRDWYDERIRRSILAASRLGVRWLVLHPSDFDADEQYDFDKAREFNLRYWTPFVEFAAEKGVGIAFENMFQSGRHQRYCSEADELIDFVRALRSPAAGICWDTGHASLSRQDQPGAIRKIGKLLKATHINDNHGQPKADEHLMPYYGTVDWPPILDALADIGYDGNFSFELKTATRALPSALCEDMLRFLHTLGNHMLRLSGKQEAP